MDKNTLLGWVVKGWKPTVDQVKAWMNSYRHIDDAIPMSAVENLEQTLNSKANVQSVNDAIAQEATARSNADTILEENINTVDADLTTESQNRQQSDAVLQANIDQKFDKTGGVVNGQVNEKDVTWLEGSNDWQKTIKNGLDELVWGITRWGQQHFWGVGASACMYFYNRLQICYIEFNTLANNGYIKINKANGFSSIVLDSNAPSEFKEDILFDPTGTALQSVKVGDAIKELASLAGSNSGIPNPISYTYAGNVITKTIEDLGSGLTIEKRYRFYSGGTGQDGSIDIMETRNTKANLWVRSTYTYTAGKLSTVANSVITAWTL